MREAPGTEVLLDPDSGRPYGVRLPKSSHVQHAAGIDDLRAMFGAGRKRWTWRLRRSLPRSGVSRHRITVVPAESVEWMDEGNVAFLQLGRTRAPWYQPLLRAEADVAGAWGIAGLQLRAVTPLGRDALRRIHACIESRELLLLSVDEGPDLEPGVYVLCEPDTPLRVRGAILKQDLAHDHLENAVRKSGVMRRLRLAGMRYYALEPAWTDSTQAQLRFWLNPEDQATCKPGWYTAEDLILWTRGEGPVVKTYAEMGVEKPAGAHGPHDPREVLAGETQAPESPETHVADGDSAS